MARYQKRGVADPFLSRRSLAFVKHSSTRQTVTPLNLPKSKDDAQTSRDLAEINKEYREKEFNVASVNGPHSLGEQHYPKSFFLTPKKEDDDAGSQ